MSEERLEEIEARYSTLTIANERGGIEYIEVDIKDLVFLIQNSFEQAEQVQELEKDIKEWEIVNECWEEINENLAEQNKRYRERIEYMLEEAKDHKRKGLRIQHWALIKDLEETLEES